ncbi:hypothetical protein TPMD03_40 [Thiohalocapsa phage LS06-2018-MD03]|nr:hypothetical protein TPMD03_40 [Thiohalocapsa phage LS06-2018-MD03]
MTTNEMKKLYETGDYVCYCRWQGKYFKDETIDFSEDIHYPIKLIHKSHEEAIDSLLDGEYLVINDTGGWYKVDNLKKYKPKYSKEYYTLRVIAPQHTEIADALVECGYEVDIDLGNCKNLYYVLNDLPNIQWTCKPHRLPKNYKQFYIVDGKPTFDKLKENTMCDQSNEDISVRVKNMKGSGLLKESNVAKSTKETISITDENGTVYKFVKPCKEIKLVYVNKYIIIGIIGAAKIASWWKNGMASEAPYNLNPIQKQWYEYEENIGKPIKVRDREDGEWNYKLFYRYKDGLFYDGNGAGWNYAEPLKYIKFKEPYLKQ